MKSKMKADAHDGGRVDIYATYRFCSGHIFEATGDLHCAYIFASRHDMMACMLW